MHFGRAALAQVDHTGPRGGAAHDGIVHHNDAFAAHRVGNEVEFHPHVEVADHLRRLQESPPDVVVAHEGVGERDAARLGVALRGVVPRIGHGDDDVRLDRARMREAPSHLDAHLGDVASAEVAVGPREIDEFENAEGRARRGKRAHGARAFFVDDHDFAGRDFAFELRADEIQRAGFRSEHVRVAEAAEDERTESVRIAHADQSLGREHDQTERALQRA